MQSRRHILISGATSGIGQAIAQGILSSGSTTRYILHLPCRNMQKAQALYTNNENVILYSCDFSDLYQISNLPNSLSKFSFSTIFNCAGSLELERKMNSQGVEKGFCTNYLSHFLLNLNIINKQETPPVIINLAGEFHRLFKFDLANLQSDKSFNTLRANSLNMLYRVMWTQALARKYKEIELQAYSYHPGRIKSGLLSKLPNYLQVLGKLASPLFSPPHIGAKTGLWLMNQPTERLVNGGYYKDNQYLKSSKQSYSAKLQDQLWLESLNILHTAGIKTI